MRFVLMTALPLLALSACGTQSAMPPTTTAAPGPTLGALPASKEPEAANSLPNGAQVNAPLTPGVGNVNSTRVGPATRPYRPATTGY